MNLHFKLDALGDITAEGNAAGVPTPNESYLYDPLDRLLQVDGATGAAWQRYTYNKTEDRLSKVMAGEGTDTYSYTSNTHHLIGITGYDVSKRAMDANGNTTAFQANGWSYGLGYNNANRLTTVQQNGSTVATYGLNGIGERVTKTLAGGGTQSYIYDESGKLLGEYATGQSRDYVWADGTLVAILDTPAQGGGTIHYVYTDNLGSPRVVTTPTGTVVWDWPYNKNPFGEAAASGNGYTLNLRYPGQYFDAETGLNYNYYRDYEPGAGRYIESDPVGLGGGLDTYGYVGQMPLDYIDPRGMWCVPLMDETTSWVTTRREARPGVDPHVAFILSWAACNYENAWHLWETRKRRTRELCFDCKSAANGCDGGGGCGFSIKYGEWTTETRERNENEVSHTSDVWSSPSGGRCTRCTDPFTGVSVNKCEDDTYGADKAAEP